MRRGVAPVRSMTDSAASYYDIEVDGKTESAVRAVSCALTDSENAVWTYPKTKDAAANIQGRFAFYKVRQACRELADRTQNKVAIA